MHKYSSYYYSGYSQISTSKSQDTGCVICPRWWMQYVSRMTLDIWEKNKEKKKSGIGSANRRK